MFSVVMGTKDRVRAFNKVCSSYNGEVDVKQGIRVIDGKSILGLFSLSLDEPAVVTSSGDEESLLQLCKEQNII